MQTPKEAFLAALRGEPHDFLPEPYGVMKDVVFPGDRYIELGDKFDPYGTGPDAWGVLWTNQGPMPAVDGNMVAKDFKLFEDVEDWKEHVKFPPLDYMPIGDIFAGMCAGMGVNPETDVVSCLLLSGAFERLNQMVGMETALCAFYECPDEMKEFLEAMCEYKLKCIDKAVEFLHPDVIHMHDDWGAEANMMFSPELWREFIKPLEKRYADHIHELGLVYVHHSCGFIEQIIPDLIEIGVDAIEPMMTTNNMEELLEKYGDKITFMGGLDNRILDGEYSTPEQIIGEIHGAIDKYLDKGRYIPYYISAKAERWFMYMAECAKYLAEKTMK